MTTYVFFKDGSDRVLDLNLHLGDSEIIQSAVVGTIDPATTPALTCSVVIGPDQHLLLTVVGGQDNTGYGVPLTVVTSVRTIEVVAAVTVKLQDFNPYYSRDPDSYTDLIGRLESGNSAVATCIFSFPQDVDAVGGHVLWELVDSQGVVYASGNAFSYKIQSNGVSSIVTAQSVVTAPSDAPPTLDRPYQIRYTLELPPQPGVQTTFYSYENLVIEGLAQLPLGTLSSIEMQGDRAQVYVVLDQAYSSVEVELYADNDKIASLVIPDVTRVSSGYYYAAEFDTAPLPVSLVPYSVVWKYGHTGGPVYRDSAQLWVANASIIMAIDDVKSKINKARTTLYGTADHQFPVEQIALWLRRAADNFNGAYGVFTNFSFTNAKGSIREYWLMYAELLALEAQYLAEGEKAFNFQGANISLDVDRTQFLDSAASKIQQRLDNEFKAMKQNLVMRGATSGDGSVDPTRLQRGAIGAVGVSISPATPYGRFSSFRR